MLHGSAFHYKEAPSEARDNCKNSLPKWGITLEGPGIFCLILLANYTKEFLLWGLPVNHCVPKWIPERVPVWAKDPLILDFLTAISLKNINWNISGEISLGMILLVQESTLASFEIKSPSDLISQEITKLVSEYSFVTEINCLIYKKQPVWLTISLAEHSIKNTDED